MAKSRGGAFGAGPSHRYVEMGLAVIIAVFALIIIGGSYKVGMDWAFDGPRAGFFPFYVGLFILGSAIINFINAWNDGDRSVLFAEWGQLRQVTFVVVPTAVYVSLVPWIGIYVASIMLIALFMRWLGRYGWGKVAVIAIGMPLVTFVVFERWFLVPLPKGPIEGWLGF